MNPQDVAPCSHSYGTRGTGFSREEASASMHV
jgi:hypothetical protein